MKAKSDGKVTPAEQRKISARTQSRKPEDVSTEAQQGQIKSRATAVTVKGEVRAGVLHPLL